MTTIAGVHKQFEIVNRALFYRDSELGYNETINAISKLANLVSECEDNDSMWALGECESATLPDVLVGAYWHCYEWHEGQASDSYACLCACGSVYSPNMTSGPEPDTGEQSVYDALAAMLAE